MKQLIEAVNTLEYKKEFYFFTCILIISSLFYLFDNSSLQFVLISMWAFSGLVIFSLQETSLLFYKIKLKRKNINFTSKDIEKRKELRIERLRLPLISLMAILIISQSSVGLSSLSESLTSCLYFFGIAIIYLNFNKISVKVKFV